MVNELIDKIRYFVPVLFSEEDRLIFLVVMTMIVMLPVFLCFLRHKPLVRGTALIIFAVYVIGNLSFTLLGRGGTGSTRLPAFESYRQAFNLDLGLKEFLNALREGPREALQYIHIGSRNAAREVFLNILLYIPMGYLLPFMIKPMRYSVIACTAAGFICSAATECAQLRYGLGYFQLYDILNNTLGCFIGAMLGCTLSRVLRTK